MGGPRGRMACSPRRVHLLPCSIPSSISPALRHIRRRDVSGSASILLWNCSLRRCIVRHFPFCSSGISRQWSLGHRGDLTCGVQNLGSFSCISRNITLHRADVTVGGPSCVTPHGDSWLAPRWPLCDTRCLVIFFRRRLALVPLKFSKFSHSWTSTFPHSTQLLLSTGWVSFYFAAQRLFLDFSLRQIPLFAKLSRCWDVMRGLPHVRGTPLGCHIEAFARLVNTRRSTRHISPLHLFLSTPATSVTQASPFLHSRNFFSPEHLLFFTPATSLCQSVSISSCLQCSATVIQFRDFHSKVFLSHSFALKRFFCFCCSWWSEWCFHPTPPLL